MNTALIIIFGFLLLAIYLGIRATRGKKMDLEQWSVGGRGFGTVFVFFLMAGEIYTTFTFLGGSAWALCATVIIFFGDKRFPLDEAEAAVLIVKKKHRDSMLNDTNIFLNIVILSLSL